MDSLVLLPAVGVRVRLKRSVARAHEFIAPSGIKGTVVYSDDAEIHVEIDAADAAKVAGLEAWDNLIVWNSCDEDGGQSMVDEFYADVDILGV